MNNLKTNIRSSDILLTEDTLSLILDNLEDSFFLIDKKLRIIATNKHTKRKMNETFGMQFRPGMSVLEMAPPERHPFLCEVYEDVFRGEERFTEIEIKKNGAVFFLENQFKPARNHEGIIIGAIVVSRDIT